MSSISEIKTNSQWTIVKTTTNKGKVTYNLKNNNGNLIVEKTDAFCEIIPINNGYGSVAIKYDKHKTVHIVWYIIDEDGNVVGNFKFRKAMENELKYLRQKNSSFSL